MKNAIEWMKKVPITIILVAINVIVFLVLEIMGDTIDGFFMVAHGAMNPSVILYNGDWYRLFTSMFMHFGGEHLLNNMLLLLVLGQYLERAVGPVKYLAIYLSSGIVGAFCSFFHMLLMGENNIAAGASGAVFGIIGALVMVVFVHKGHYETFTTKRMLLMAALALYAGFSAKGVDNVNHIGGLITGLFLCFFIYGIPHLIHSYKEHKISESD